MERGTFGIEGKYEQDDDRHIEKKISEVTMSKVLEPELPLLAIVVLPGIKSQSMSQ